MSSYFIQNYLDNLATKEHSSLSVYSSKTLFHAELNSIHLYVFQFGVNLNECHSHNDFNKLSGRENGSPYFFFLPDWDHWFKNTSTITITESVSLSLGINPPLMNHYKSKSDEKLKNNIFAYPFDDLLNEYDYRVRYLNDLLTRKSITPLHYAVPLDNQNRPKHGLGASSLKQLTEEPFFKVNEILTKLTTIFDVPNEIKSFLNIPIDSNSDINFSESEFITKVNENLSLVNDQNKAVPIYYACKFIFEEAQKKCNEFDSNNLGRMDELKEFLMKISPETSFPDSNNLGKIVKAQNKTLKEKNEFELLGHFNKEETGIWKKIFPEIFNK